MFATGVTMGLAEWIIDDTCLVYIKLERKKLYGYLSLLSADFETDVFQAKGEKIESQVNKS